MCISETKMVARGLLLGNLTPAETQKVGVELAVAFVTKFKPSYEDDAANAIENALDQMLSQGVKITEADLDNPAFQGALFALVNHELGWDER